MRKRRAGRTAVEEIESGEPLEIECLSWADGQAIPPRYSRDDTNDSPPISWARLPEETQSIAVICEDPDAAGEAAFVHWVIYNIPPKHPGLPEGISKTAQPLEIPGCVQGLNHFGEIGYDGPQPSRGHGVHHYHFRVFALDAVLPIEERITKERLIDAMRGHVLASGEIVGTFHR